MNGFLCHSTPDAHGMKHMGVWMENIRRTFAFPFPVKCLAYIPANVLPANSLVHHTLNFALLLSGTPDQLEWLCDKSRFKMRFPCLKVTIPGKTYTNLTKAVVNQFYVVYDAGLLKAFRRVFPGLDEPCRELTITPHLSSRIKHIHHLAENCHGFGVADRLDVCCYELIVETMLCSCEKAGPDDPDTIVRRIASLLEVHFAEPVSWDTFLNVRGLSYRSFIRHWNRAFSISPTRFVNTLRIREAQRLLTATGLSIKEIAQQVGVEDTYYFSRLFRTMAGISPHAYRKKAGKGRDIMPSAGQTTSLPKSC